MTDRNGDKINVDLVHYGDGGIDHLSAEQTDEKVSANLRRYHANHHRHPRAFIFHLTIYDKLVKSNYQRATAYAYALGTKNASKKFPAEHYPIHSDEECCSL